MVKGHQKRHVGTRYKGNLIIQFIVYDNWYTETGTYK